MTSAREAVQTVASNYGYGNRTSEINSVAGLFENGHSDSDIVDRLTSYGLSAATAGAAVTAVREMFVPQPAVFDKAEACRVIRSLISASDTRHNGRGGYSDDEVTALLVLAGLEDEPDPEVQVEVTSQGMFNRLLDWARGQGFRG